MMQTHSHAHTKTHSHRYLHPATREWKEGLVSVTFRDMANNKVNKHQVCVGGRFEEAAFTDRIVSKSVFLCMRASA